jgi:hypothetical protein
MITLRPEPSSTREGHCGRLRASVDKLPRNRADEYTVTMMSLERIRVGPWTLAAGCESREEEIEFLQERQRLAWKGEGQIILISAVPAS